MKGILSKFAIRSWPLALVIGLCVSLLGANLVAATPARAAETIRLASSAQIYESLGPEGLDLFTEKSGVKVDLVVTTSATAIGRLENGLCDVAASAEGLKSFYKSQGFMEFPFARDALVIVINPQNKVLDLKPDQVQGIFHKSIGNWKQVGGEDLPILVFAPSGDSALYHNFSNMVMQGVEITPDVTTAKSTFAADVARRYKNGISFVNLGAAHGRPEGSRIVKINGLAPDAAGYPFVQAFSLVTKGEPKGAVQKFVEFVSSKEFCDYLTKKRGVLPCK
ncbi:MAG: substrate-binding domain-containing protein [Proteobacteria bacterium]|nr:substrate-binding domain-containing protein [Pseudomonadota bacterium]